MALENFIFRPRSSDRYWLAFGVVTALFFMLVPFVGSIYAVSVAFSILLFGVLAASWNIISGYTGYISFGHAAFFGLGAYSGALLIVKQGFDPLMAIAAAGVITTLVSIPMATATLRLDDVQFSIIMLAFAQILLYATQTFDGITEGVQGVVMPILDLSDLLYFLLLGLAIVTTVVTYLVDRTHIGLALTAIHDDEDAATAMGVHTIKYKVLAFTLSAIFPGLAGALAALHWTFINPTSVFSVMISGDMMIMSVLGGMGTVIGPLLGSLVLTPLRIEASAQFPYLHGIVFGGLFLIFVLTMPEGFVTWIKQNRVLSRLKQAIGGEES